MRKRVVFRKKSIGQRNNCLGPRCKNESTLEAVYGISRIRCCDNKECKDFAANLAKSFLKTATG